MKKINAYIITYGWYDGSTTHGVFTDLGEAKNIVEHLQILFPKDVDRFHIERLKLNTFYSAHLKDLKRYNHGKGQQNSNRIE